MRSVLRGIGEILVTCGVVVALFMAYMFWGTGLREGDAQQRFASELGGQWAAPGLSQAGLDSGRLVPGHPFAFIRIPAFGRSWRFAVVEGTAFAQLALGPGHVTGTAAARPGRQLRRRRAPGDRGQPVLERAEPAAGRQGVHRHHRRNV